MAAVPLAHVNQPALGIIGHESKHYSCSRAVFTGRQHDTVTRLSCWTLVLTGRVHGRLSTRAVKASPVNTGVQNDTRVMLK